MAHIVAVDFNPRVSIFDIFIESRRDGAYNRLLYASSLRDSEEVGAIHRRIEIRRYNIGHPYGILNKKDVGNGQGLNLDDVKKVPSV
jgi:hypothetical protein